MKRNKYRIKRCEVIEDAYLFPCYKVQIMVLGCIWVTVKKFVEYYPDMGIHVSARNSAEDLLERLIKD